MSKTDGQSMIDVLMNIGIDTLDGDKLRVDEAEFQKISNEFPDDGLVDIAQYERMAGLAMRGIAICDYWVPILMVIIGELESKRDIAKAKAYVDAEEPKYGKLTADVRKQMSEANEEYNRVRILTERIRAIKVMFEKKSHSFTKFHVFMKDQQKLYSYKGGREISGDTLKFSSEKPDKKTNGEENW